jgi:hypothetical protein
MCVRRAVAQRWAEVIASDPLRQRLGRRGNGLGGAEDCDLALTACDLGLGMGLFTALKMEHLIPPSRLEESYIRSLARGMGYSGAILSHVRKTLRRTGMLRQLLSVARSAGGGMQKMRFAWAAYCGRRAAYRDIAAVSTGHAADDGATSVGALSLGRG